MDNIPADIQKAFDESAKYFATPIQQFQFFDKYSRFDYEKVRRETWAETVDRSVNFLKEISEDKLPEKEYKRIRKFMLEMKATPSMRLIAMAGEAARRQNICIYNCSFLPIDDPQAWVEALIISMSGCGVGFSVEKMHIDKLPVVHEQNGTMFPVHTIADTTEGWAEALRDGLDRWFGGGDITFDYSEIRPSGALLKVKGGRASGPEPLQKMLDFTRKIILGAQGRKLTSLEAHDIMCEVGNAAVSGGMRRTAMISLFDWDDEEMKNCKNGDLEAEGNTQRWNANNSAVWPKDISAIDVMNQFIEMDKGGRGEPGIFSRDSARATMPKRRLALGEYAWGTNPCGEIVLRPYEFCNLTIAIARENDTYEELQEKVEVATIIGTIQSMATNFPGLRPKWVENCKEERLLGVDITGQMDCRLLNGFYDKEDIEWTFEQLQHHAFKTNQKFAKLLGIEPSASITCNKPSGNSSQLFNCASGIHARHYPYYIRNVRVNPKSPIFQVLKDAKVPMDPENGQTAENANAWVIHFPMKSPEGARTQENVSALEQCEVWFRNKKYWTEHNPSVTISYKPEELPALTAWVWEHREFVGGMSFLPIFDAKYDQMPYTPISEEEYERLSAEFPKIDFARLSLHESEDYTTAAQELACLAGACEIDFSGMPQK